MYNKFKKVVDKNKINWIKLSDIETKAFCL